jgi:hypothetical protein
MVGAGSVGFAGDGDRKKVRTAAAIQATITVSAPM